LQDYAVTLLRGLSHPDALGLSRLLLREGREFPEVADAVTQAFETVLAPLTQLLAQRNLEEEEGASEYAELLMAMILQPFLARVGTDLPPLSEAEIQQHARQAVTILLEGVESRLAQAAEGRCG
jgi:hypothetical protein